MDGNPGTVCRKCGGKVERAGEPGATYFQCTGCGAEAIWSQAIGNPRKGVPYDSDLYDVVEAQVTQGKDINEVKRIVGGIWDDTTDAQIESAYRDAKTIYDHMRTAHPEMYKKNPGNPNVKRLGWGNQAFAEKPWGKGIVSLVKLADPKGGDVWLVDYNDESVGKGLLSTTDFNKARNYFDSLNPGGNPGVDKPGKSILVLPITSFRPEMIRVVQIGREYYVQSQRPGQTKWITQKTWLREEDAIKDAEGWYLTVVTPERAREILEQAKERTRTGVATGPWADQLKYVEREGERAYVVSQWDKMPGTYSYVDALVAIGGRGGNPGKSKLQVIKEKQGAYFKRHGRVTEADFSINDIQRELALAYLEEHPDAHVGLVNRHDAHRNFIQKYNGEKILNFEWDFITPHHDNELLKLLLAREQATYTGTKGDMERLKPIWARIEQAGGLYFHWA